MKTRKMISMSEKIRRMAGKAAPTVKFCVSDLVRSLGTTERKALKLLACLASRERFSWQLTGRTIVIRTALV